MPRLDESRDDLLQALVQHYGPPATLRHALNPEWTLFERLARVTLGLVANPKLAEAAFLAFRDAGLLEPARLAVANPLELDDILKHDRVPLAIKSLRPLQKLARWATEFAGDLDDVALAETPTSSLRDEWRAINGIGLATADSLLLFGLGRSSYPVDRATYRVLVRHSWLDPTAEYDDARELVERFASSEGTGSTSVPKADGDQNRIATRLVLEQLSDWFARLGRDFCRPSQAKCDRCPFHPWLPLGGPVEPESS